MFEATPNVALSTGGFVCLRFKGMSPHVVFVVGFFVVVLSKLHKKMVLCQEGFEVDEAQATLEQQISEKKKRVFLLSLGKSG